MLLVAPVTVEDCLRRAQVPDRHSAIVSARMNCGFIPRKMDSSPQLELQWTTVYITIDGLPFIFGDQLNVLTKTNQPTEPTNQPTDQPTYPTNLTHPTPPHRTKRYP